MDKRLKQALREAYRAPDPVEKAAFLKRNRRRELGRWELLAVQVRYIRWWVWGASLALFGAILWAAFPMDGPGGWYAAAFTPFLALLAVMENGRSGLYQMEELELACRMARQSVILARMVVLGLFHLALLAGLTPLLAAWGGAGVLWTGMYLLTPYLLTAALGMELTRRIRGRECLLACGGASVLVSGAGILLAYQGPALYQQSAPGRQPSLSLWLAALLAAASAAAVEVKLNLKDSEELQWN